MNGEEQRPQRSAEQQRRRWFLFASCRLEQLDDHQVDQPCRHGVEHRVGEVVTARVHPPKDIVETKGEPRERVIVAEMESSEHPLEVLERETAVARVVEEVTIVVPVDEVVSNSGKENEQRNREDQQWKPPSLFLERALSSCRLVRPP